MQSKLSTYMHACMYTCASLTTSKYNPTSTERLPNKMYFHAKCEQVVSNCSIYYLVFLSDRLVFLWRKATKTNFF